MPIAGSTSFNSGKAPDPAGATPYQLFGIGFALYRNGSEKRASYSGHRVRQKDRERKAGAEQRRGMAKRAKLKHCRPFGTGAGGAIEAPARDVNECGSVLERAIVREEVDWSPAVQ